MKEDEKEKKETVQELMKRFERNVRLQSDINFRLFKLKIFNVNLNQRVD